MANEQNANPVALARVELEQMEAQFANALPAHIPVERFTRVLMTALQNAPGLMACDRQSLWNAAMKAAQDGLLPDGRLGAIVPYKGKAQWLPMIAGIRQKVRNSGEIATWDVHAVYANDEFDYELGDDPFIRHKPAGKDRGEIILCYSIATLKSGEKSREVMTIEEIEEIRERSSQSKSGNGPWDDPVFYPEMCKKTVAKRHSKVLPMSTDLDDLLRRDDELYDRAGAGDKAVKGARKGLADRIGALAAPATASNGGAFDPQTGEVIEGDVGKGAAAAQEGKPAAAKAAAAPAAVASTADSPAGNGGGMAADATEGEAAGGYTQAELEEAFERGVVARGKKMVRKAVPPEWREPAFAPLLDNYLAGWDSAPAAKA